MTAREHAMDELGSAEKLFLGAVCYAIFLIIMIFYGSRCGVRWARNRQSQLRRATELEAENKRLRDELGRKGA